MDGIRSEQVDASTSVCPGGIVGIRSVGACDVISRVPRALVDRARFAEKQDERADDQHGEHQNLELIDDCDDGRLAVTMSLSAASPGLEIEPVTWAAAR